MTARSARFKKADVTRAVRAVMAAGFMPGGCRIEPNGSIVVLIENGGSSKSDTRNPWDDEL
jgi:hypothetical protein